MHCSVQTDKWIAWQRLFSGTTKRVHNWPFAHSKSLQMLGQHGQTRVPGQSRIQDSLLTLCSRPFLVPKDERFSVAEVYSDTAQ